MPGRSISGWLRLVARRTIGAVGILAALCLVVMLLIIFSNVILRYTVGSPLYWGDEAMINLMMMMAYASFGFVLAEGGHIRVTIVFGKLPIRVQNALWIIISLLGVGYASFLLYAMALLVIDSLRLGSFSNITRWPIFPWQILIALGLFALVVAFIVFVAERVGISLGVMKGEEKTKEKEDILTIKD